MIPSQRVPSSAIVDRAPLTLPGGARLVVWPIVNVEVWDIGRPMPRQVLPPPQNAAHLPDLPHWAWHEYGMRVGFWRLKEAFDDAGITPTLSINARVCLDYERVARAARDSGWEFMGHSYDQRPMHLEPDQRATIHKAVGVIRDYTGKQPVGWLGPGLTETLSTPDWLAEAGIRYIADWVIDDEPCEIETAHGRVLSMPYTVELNDISIMMIGRHAAAEFETRCMDYFERVYAESQKRAKVMAIAVHPYISGVPHRIKYLERVFDALKKHDDVLFWTGEQILEWYKRNRAHAGQSR